VIWPVTVAALVWVVATDDMITYALEITAGVFVVAIVFLGWGAWATNRRDRARANGPGREGP
jgi:predicted lysophospholipase L1 biosynthesis ABC-type transport system permease subunit